MKCLNNVILKYLSYSNLNTIHFRGTTENRIYWFQGKSSFRAWAGSLIQKYLLQLYRIILGTIHREQMQVHDIELQSGYYIFCFYFCTIHTTKASLERLCLKTDHTWKEEYSVKIYVKNNWQSVPSHTFCQIQEIQATCYTAALTTAPAALQYSHDYLHQFYGIASSLSSACHCHYDFSRQLPKQYFSPCHSLLHLTSAAHYLPMSLLTCWTWWRWMLTNRWIHWLLDVPTER